MLGARHAPRTSKQFHVDSVVIESHTGKEDM